MTACSESPVEESYSITLDDDPNVAKIISAATKKNSISFLNSRDLLENGKNYNPVAVFVDIHLGENESGLDSVPAIRAMWPNCPIIIITADESDEATEEALGSGADDLVVKPIRPKEINARLQLRIRESNLHKSSREIELNDIIIDSAHGFVRGPAGESRLSPTELNLIKMFAENIDNVVLRQTIKRQCWDRLTVSEGALDRKIYEVRKILKKIESKLELRTIYGKGVGLFNNT